MGNKENNFGGWRPYSPPENDHKNILKKALAKLGGTGDEAILVSTQIGSETNYRFICRPNPPVYGIACVACVEVSDLVSEEPRVVNIHPYKLSNEPGGDLIADGYGEYILPTEEDKKILEDIVAEFLGSKFEPLLASTQIVDGRNILFLSLQSKLTNPTFYELTYVNILVSLEGEATLIALCPLDLSF